MDVESWVAAAHNQAALAQSCRDLEQLRVHYLGRKGQITEALKALSTLPHEQRRTQAQVLNGVKQRVTALIRDRRVVLEQEALDQQLHAESVDVTLPGHAPGQGAIHPVTQVQMRLCAIFRSLGFDVLQGPEIETAHYNFTALNIPEHHPSRALHDTFYLDDQWLLRTHTSSVQIHAMESSQPPLRVVVPGKVYRCDSDATHTPMFHQMEGLVVDQHSNFAQLKGLLEVVICRFFEKPLHFRFRPTYFPFTAPSAEVDMQCLICQGEKTSCSVCKNTGWLEVLGCGMVHPNVLSQVHWDPEVYQGFAFGLGMDRLAMLLYGIHDLRLFFENDHRFLGQFL